MRAQHTLGVTGFCLGQTFNQSATEISFLVPWSIKRFN